MIPRLGPGALAEVGRQPWLWLTALAEWRALTGPRWWARWPPVPVPPRGYMSFRLETMYGAAGGTLSGAEVVAYLKWCRWMRALAR